MSEGERTTRIVRPLRGGQITIPAEFRKKLGITEQSLLRMSLATGKLEITLVEARPAEPGSAWFKELYDRFSPVRDEAAAMSEEEVNIAIDQAVEAARSDHV